MNGLTDLIKKHQVTAFFIITFVITWGLGFAYIGFYKGMYYLLPLGFIATCGPALAGIIISAVSNTQPRQGSSKSRWIAFLLAWVASALVFLAHITLFDHAPFSPVLVGFTIVSVIPVAFVISMAYSRIPAVKRQVSSLTRLRGVWGWSFLALAIYPALILLSIPISSLLSRPSVAAQQLPGTGLALIGLIVIKFSYQFLFFNATGEEVGWRGFALPRLQARTSPLIASLILAFFWVPWHFMLWKAQGQPVMNVNFWFGSNSLLIILSSVISAWFYNRSKGSILVAGIDHAAENSTISLLFIQDWNVYLALKTILVLAVILVDRMWKRLPLDHPAVYQESPPVDLHKEGGI